MSASEPALDALRAAIGRKYEIQRLLGRGGMGAVYLARDVELDRPVAIKVLPEEFAKVPELRERFLRETKTAASFSHPNIVPVFGIEDRDGLLAFAMGYVEGESVAERVKRAGPLSVKELVRLLQDVGYALAYAHGRGVVHRDIKPDNIMLERATGRALLMDFGISRVITTTTVAQGLTRVGEVVGTPEFMSPEQASGDVLSGRSDIYSLGLVAWFAATGVLAISGESTQKIIVRQITEAIPPVRDRRADLPQALGDAIDRCVRKDPEERFASAEALVETLDTARLAGPEVPMPIRIFAAEASQAGLVLLGGGAMTYLLFLYLALVVKWDLDVIMPVVLVAAIIWGRLAQTVQMARRLAQRGFSVDAIQTGLAAIGAERDADRAQLRADPTAVSRRRRQVVILLGVLALTILVREYVVRFERTEIRPGYNQVSPIGVYLLYALYAARGIALVGLVRSPLRRPVGEWLFRWFWLGAPGRVVLGIASRGVAAVGTGSQSLARAVTGAGMTPALSRVSFAPTAAVARESDESGETTPVKPSVLERLERLEQRVDRLENR
jgi:eukaryotic-like serine/threonine-protein kinase